MIYFFNFSLKFQKVSELVKWNRHRCNFDQYLQTLRCDGLDIYNMKYDIARELCTVHNIQTCALIKQIISMIDKLDVRYHRITCNSIRRGVKSLQLDHEIDFREFKEWWLNVLSFIEISKGHTLQHVLANALNNYYLLISADREEVIKLLGKTSTDINNVDTYRIIEIYILYAA